MGNFGTLLLVADGMGGESAGEIASQICTATVPKRLYDNLKSLDRISEVNFVLLLREAIEYANQVIHQQLSRHGNDGNGVCSFPKSSFRGTGRRLPRLSYPERQSGAAHTRLDVSQLSG